MAKTIVAVRTLDAVRSEAVGWDIPHGHGGDAPEFTGRAALAARYLGDALGKTDAVSLQRRHRLLSDDSCYSFWGPDATAPTILDRVAAVRADGASGGARALIPAQLAQAKRHTTNAQLRFLGTIHEAAWGWSNRTVLGDPETLQRSAAQDFDEYVARCLADGAIVSSSPARPRGGPREQRWHGDVVLAEASGRQCRVGVQVVLADRLSGPAVSAVLSEWLGGARGLLVRRMRKERGVAYGSMAQVQELGGTHTVTLGVSGLQQDLPAVVDGLGTLLKEIDSAALGVDVLTECAQRVEHRLMSELDSPFGRLDDVRRVRDGHQPLARVIADLPDAVTAVAEPGRVGHAAVAVGYVGECASDVPGLLEAMR